jgi:hypothetical protein
LANLKQTQYNEKAKITLQQQNITNNDSNQETEFVSQIKEDKLEQELINLNECNSSEKTIMNTTNTENYSLLHKCLFSYKKINVDNLLRLLIIL